MDPIGKVEDAIGYRFEDPTLLATALTHSSFVAEHPDAESYERMEFLGDAVLGLVTTDLIYEAMDEVPEGRMTKLRASVVDEATLAGMARTWGLGPALRLGVGEDRTGGRRRASILSDGVEATIAAVFLDGGYSAAADLVARFWADLIHERASGPDEIIDSRSKLQEVLASRGLTVSFHFHRSGPDHAAVFDASAVVEGEVVGRGVGSSKKAAAIDAARDAIESGTLTDIG